jgi:predicted component of type VI protein secretion system
MGGRPNNWELYGEIYRTLVEAQTDSGLPHNFAESFATAYSAEAPEEN